MDPIAHTLAGACLAETGLKHWTRRATATLMIGANLPDVDAFTTFLGHDAMLLHRRGWTHGVLAMGLLPMALAGSMVLYDRLRPGKGAPMKPWRLVVLSYLSVWSHPVLDWMNTYGVRLGMPFDGSWYYGDSLFILEAWLWLLPGAAVFLARSGSRGALLAWLGLAGVLSIPVVLGPGVHPVLAASWLIGLVLAAVAKRTGVPRTVPTARAVVVLLVAYALASVGLTRSAISKVTTQMTEQGVSVETAVALPQPGVPWTREVVVVTPDQYLFRRFDVLGTIGLSGPPVTRRVPPVEVSAALIAQAPGFANWLRLPAYFETETGWTVLDVRYVRSLDEPLRGIGRFDLSLPAPHQQAP